MACVYWLRWWKRTRAREREGERVWEREKGWDRKRIKTLASTNNFNSI